MAYMGVRDYLPGLGTEGTPITHHECRSCGTTLEEGQERCPACDGPVVTYEL
jgi:rubrerythrin